MSGSGKNKIGTMTLCHGKKAECTEEVLSDWYMNYVKKNSDSKFHVIIYDDAIDADLQSIAVDLCTKVKEMDLGIGYFCIAFQKDDYTLTAISSVDDLNTQEATEITTETF